MFSHYSKILVALAVLLPSAAADHTSADKRKAVLLDGLGDVHHPVSTRNAEAQQFFDQGLRLLYAFNHDEARLAFQRAAELDPQLAMAHWGIGLSVGPNYNLDAEPPALKQAYAAVETARRLAAQAPEHERDYIAALAKRYAVDPARADKKQLAISYKNAMGELVKKYPDDLDAATLYAESMMNLRPWELWSPDGKPAENTREILDVLESVLRRNPRHTGAHHYYIHAIEASPTPERGLASAHVLAQLAPAAGHLVHMPAHIYLRVGEYDAAARANDAAAKVDASYIQRFKVQGVYPMMYYSHNLHFLAVAHAMQGRYTDAKTAADRLAQHVAPHVKEMPALELFLPTPLLIQVRFQKWNDILASPAPDANLTITKSLWHYARGAALLSSGKIEPAAAELAALTTLRKSMPADLGYGDRNKARAVLAIPQFVLQGRIALALGKRTEGLRHLEQAIAAEDQLSYIEPADWYLPVRETLGAALLRQGDASGAEKAFRGDLERNRRHGRSLFGLSASLKMQGKDYAAVLVHQEFQAAWRHADPKEFRLEDLP